MVASHHPNEIRILRTYQAPLQLVWEAWNDPDQAAKWWGPRGFTITTHGKDLRPGGYWSYTMHGPDGTDYVNKTIYHEVEPLKKLVYDHGGSDDRPPLFRVTVLFTETDGETTMDMTMRLPTAEEAEATRKMIKAVGGNATWDRLAEYLNEVARQKHSFVIHRSFDSSCEQLFEMWTNPDRLASWLPPPGFDMAFLKTESHLGGVSRFAMQSPSQPTIYGEIEARESDRPGRFVYLQRFCDADGQLARHPALPLFPATLLMTVTFTVEDAASARVTLVAEPLQAGPQEVDVFLQTRSSMTQGWSASFDKLEALLAGG